MKKFSVLVSTIIGGSLLLLAGIGCQSKTGKTPIVTKERVGSSAKENSTFPAFRTKGKGMEACLDLPELIKDLHNLGTDIVRVFTVDLFVSNIESKSLELSDKATSIDSAGVDLLKRSRPHASLPFAKKFENGWIEFPFKQDECRSVSFIQMGDSSQEAPTDGAAAPPSTHNVDQKATQFPTIANPEAYQIIEKSRRSIVYDFMVGKSVTRYGIYAQGANSMLIKIISYRSLPSPEGGEMTYLTRVSKRVQWGNLKSDVTISLRLARIWIKAIGEEQAPRVVLERVKKQKPDADPDSLISIPLDVYLAMNASKELQK